MIHPERERTHLDPSEIEPHTGIGVEAIELRHHAHTGGRSKRDMKRGSGKQPAGGGPGMEIEISSRREESASPSRTEGHVVFEGHCVEARKPRRGRRIAEERADNPGSRPMGAAPPLRQFGAPGEDFLLKSY